MSRKSTVTFIMRVPTAEELQSCRHIVLGSTDEWDPDSKSSSDQANGDMVSVYSLQSLKPSSIQESAHRITDSDSILATVSHALSDATFAPKLVSQVQVASAISTTTVKTRHSKITAPELAKKFGIGFRQAKRTLQVTTQ